MTISSDQFWAATWAICKCLFSVKDNKLERLLQQYALFGLAIIQRPVWATKELRARRDENRVAQSCSLVVYADSDVVPAVRCQQGGWRVVRLSAWVWDIVWREKKQKCMCMCMLRISVCVCRLTCPSSLVWVRLSNKTNGRTWNLQVEAANSTNRAHTSVWPTIVTGGLYTVYWWFLVKSARLKVSWISGVLSSFSLEIKYQFSISCFGQ